jgi:hypothetical protein
MPRRAIHAHPSSIVIFRFVILSEAMVPRSGAIAQSKDLYRSIFVRPRRHCLFVQPHNNPVITQNLNRFALRPKPRSRTLPRPRVPHKQIAHAVSPDNAGAVQLDGSLLREAMHDEEFIEGIRQRRQQESHFLSNFATQLQPSLREASINEKSLVRPAFQSRSVKVKAEAISVLVQSPGASGVKNLAGRKRGQQVCQFHLNGNVGVYHACAECTQALMRGEVVLNAKAQDFDAHASYAKSSRVVLGRFLWLAKLFREASSHFAASLVIAGIYDPMLLHTPIGVQPKAELLPPPLKVLQWPKTASSGRKLIVINFGASYCLFPSA